MRAVSFIACAEADVKFFLTNRQKWFILILVTITVCLEGGIYDKTQQTAGCDSYLLT